MAVVISYDKSGILSVIDYRQATIQQEYTAASVFTTGWSTIDEVASKKQSWETVSSSTGAVTGSHQVTP